MNIDKEEERVKTVPDMQLLTEKLEKVLVVYAGLNRSLQVKLANLKEFRIEDNLEGKEDKQKDIPTGIIGALNGLVLRLEENNIMFTKSLEYFDSIV